LLADGTRLPTIMHGELGTSPFMADFRKSKALDRASKLHGHRIDAHSISGQKHGRTSNAPSGSDSPFIGARPGEALAVQTPDVPQKLT
jgi:hypothetical protein